MPTPAARPEEHPEERLPSSAPPSGARARQAWWHDPAVACLILFLASCAILLGIILHLNQGHFIYSLDDPYIHLALSERIARGLYGINPGEMVTPSSSILWPFLLLPGAGTPWHQYLPLVLNLIFGSIAAWLIGNIARSFSWIQTGPYQILRCWSISLLLVFAASLPGLAFTGMEHVLQVLTAVACAYALIEALSGRRIPSWSIVLVILSPGVRYEDFVLCVALAIALSAQRRTRTALASLALSAVLPVAFALFLHRHGMPPLPNSVLAKGAVFASNRSVAANLLATMRTNAVSYLIRPNHWPLSILLPLLLAAVWTLRRNRLQALIAGGAALALLLHLLAGSYGWFHRYEVYAKIFALLVLLASVSLQRLRIPFLAPVVLLLFIDFPSFLAFAQTPRSSEDIYLQQYQMHRFIQQYRGNLAVNDIGWISFNLPPENYMLDLYGLASSESLHQLNRNAAWLEQITQAHNVGLVMIYPQWYNGIPSDWTPVASLTLGVPSILTQPQVYFYETPEATPGQRRNIDEILHSFGATLPPQAIFLLNPPPPAITSSAGALKPY